MWGGRMTTQGHLGTLIGFRQKLFTGSDGILRVPSERKSELTMHGINLLKYTLHEEFLVHLFLDLARLGKLSFNGYNLLGILGSPYSLPKLTYQREI
jgi:hypothetical protein